MIRVLIVEDSRTSAFLLKSVLETDPGIKVVGFARSGAEGLQKTLTLTPDIVTMDVHMPGMDGFQATRLIMEKAPRPIIMVTGSLDSDEVNLSFNSLKAGALAILKKPVGPESPDYQSSTNEFISMVKLMAELKVVSRYPRKTPEKRAEILRGHKEDFQVIAIGASTGGPAAISTIISHIPERIQTPILIVQHISDGFDTGFAEWLGSTTKRHVRIAEDGMILEPGMVLVAPRGKQMGLKEFNQVELNSSREIDSDFCPSANYLFKTVGSIHGKKAIGIILTGMGHDGLEGLKLLKQYGGYVVAQDEASCVVYGMPKAAIDAGIVDQIAALEEIAKVIIKLVEKEKV